MYYAGQEGWHPLPGWASFFAATGAATATHNSTTLRLIIGVALPARAFSAALAATEIVITRSALARTVPDTAHEMNNRFEELCRMAPGTPITLLNPATNRTSGARDRKLNGVITECASVHGEQRLKITVDAGGGSYLIAARDSWRVEPSSMPRNLPRRQTGQLVAPVKAFARHLLGEDTPGANRPRTRLDCVVLGRARQLAHEVSGVDFAVKTDSGAFESGILQDVIRARRFVTGDASFHSEVLRVDGSKPAPIRRRNDMSETEIQRAHDALLKRIKAHLPQLLELQRQMNEAEDEGVYYYYHSDPRTYGLQHFTERACSLFRKIASHDEGNLTLPFELIVRAGTNRTPDLALQGRAWIQDAGPVISAFYHARYFVNQHVHYAREFSTSPDNLPPGWAAILCL